MVIDDLEFFRNLVMIKLTEAWFNMLGTISQSHKIHYDRVHSLNADYSILLK